ncbi:hypothetical protein J4050_08655 [Winogradskyella sp. DF17]|uniref:Tetratricopeptide repeat protein n=1 Tax=Winogradskyella pelagia TaxID=2819984 RepID=A0ABS3T4Z9_9FLAO|nr:hypothetical protein [Winogradskyella sp. DF17]MBO3116815.1 hypothetical protein [Winogradskyella sp. DF17]
MKTIITYLALILALQLFSSTFLIAQNIENIVKAYEQRMNGDIEGAKAILNDIIKIDSTNALAYFEMARTVEDSMKLQFITKSIALDSTNTMFLFYQANLYMLDAYRGMKSNNKTIITKNINKCIATLKRILEINNDCRESILFLVDLYGTLPKDMGGNPRTARLYLDKLKPIDSFYAAQGEWILKSKNIDADIVKHWKNYIENNAETENALIKLGKAYLLKNEIGMADEVFNKIIKIDSSQIILKLDVARAYLYSAMRGGDEQNRAIQGFKKYINVYLESNVSKPKLIQAWSYGWLGMIEGRQGNNILAEEYYNKAESLIPNYPKYTAIPKIENQPNILTYKYSSYFSAF